MIIKIIIINRTHLAPSSSRSICISQRHGSKQSGYDVNQEKSPTCKLVQNCPNPAPTSHYTSPKECILAKLLAFTIFCQPHLSPALQQNCFSRLSIALAILFPMDVFPTPGGPTKHMIFPWTEPGRRTYRKLDAGHRTTKAVPLKIDIQNEIVRF